MRSRLLVGLSIPAAISIAVTVAGCTSPPTPVDLTATPSPNSSKHGEASDGSMVSLKFELGREQRSLRSQFADDGLVSCGEARITVANKGPAPSLGVAFDVSETESTVTSWTIDDGLVVLYLGEGQVERVEQSDGSVLYRASDIRGRASVAPEDPAKRGISDYEMARGQSVDASTSFDLVCPAP